MEVDVIFFIEAPLYLYSRLLIMYLTGTEHAISLSPQLLIQYDTRHTFATFVALNKHQKDIICILQKTSGFYTE